MTSLYAWRKEEVELAGAIADCAEALQGAVGLFYSLPWCRFGQLKQDNNTIKVHDFEGEMQLDLVFEARIFNQTAELRWLKSGELGTAVLLSEEEDWKGANLPDGYNKTTLDNLEALDRSNYLLWGEGTNIQKNGWSCLTAARIGKLYVPIAAIEPKKRVQLVVQEYIGEVEYIGKVDKYGNMAVVEERLIKLKSYQFQEKKSDGHT